MGFEKVFEYTDGKLDWMAAGLPTEGEEAEQPDAGSVARSNVPTCALDEKVGEIKQRIADAGWDECVVVNSEQIVLGLLREKELAGDAERTAEEAMLAGPGTYRPYLPIGEMAQVLVDRDLSSTIVTTSEGRLIGMLRRSDAIEAFHRSHSHHHHESAAAG